MFAGVYMDVYCENKSTKSWFGAEIQPDDGVTYPVPPLPGVDVCCSCLCSWDLAVVIKEVNALSVSSNVLIKQKVNHKPT